MQDNEQPAKRFGEKLHTLRKKHRMTLKGLSRELGFDSHSYINAIELGNKQPSVALVVRLARLFNVSTDQLLLDELEVD